jgi:uncharacterized protein DUF2786
MSTMSQVIDKIQKLRRLATSSNVHEAAAAAALADKLIQEHGLQEAQLEAEGKAPGEKPSLETEPVAAWTGLTPAWQMALGGLLCNHYDCACYRENIRREGKRVGEVLRIVGRPSDVSTFRYMYAWLVLEIERLAQAARPVEPCRSPADLVAYRNSFRHGAVNGVIYAMRNAKAEAQKQATSAAIVLVNARQAEAEAAMAAAAGKLRSTKLGRASRGDGFRDGHKAGQNLHGRDKAALPTGGARQLTR